MTHRDHMGRFAILPEHAEALVTLYRWHQQRDHMGRHLDPPAIPGRVLGRLRDAGYTARRGSSLHFATRHSVTRRGAIVAQRLIRDQRTVLAGLEDNHSDKRVRA